MLSLFLFDYNRIKKDFLAQDKYERVSNGTGIEGIKVILETNLTGNIADENDWQEVGTTYTNSQGYYIS